MRLLVIALVTLCAVQFAAVGAPRAGGPQSILDKAQTPFKGIRDLSAQLAITMKALGLSFPLKGKLFFKRPDKLKLDIQGLPRMLRERQSAFGEFIPTHLTGDHYSIVSHCTVRLKGKECWQVTLAPRNKSEKLALLDMWVDRAALTTPFIRGCYRDGTVIEAATTFAACGRYRLPRSQALRFAFPAYTCDAAVKYSNYSINSGLPDSLFK